jgi:IS4 transposase
MKSSFPDIYKKKHMRKIIVRDPADIGKKITLLTNNLKWSVSTVYAVYKDRWQIEVFFKVIKQNLKIKRFYRKSVNAVMTQSYTQIR